MRITTIAEYAKNTIVEKKRHKGKSETISPQYVRWCIDNGKIHLLPNVQSASKIGKCWILTLTN